MSEFLKTLIIGQHLTQELTKKIERRYNTYAELEQQLAEAQAQSARRLEGLCKCGIEKDQLRQKLAIRDAEVARLREQMTLLRTANPVGAVLVNRESRKGIMFYSNDMIPEPSTIKDKFELIKVYEALDATEPKP